MTLIWKDIPGYPSYQASESGDIRRVINGKVKSISLFSNKSKYVLANVRNIDDKPVTRLVHRLVALAFIGDSPDEERVFINHKDGFPWNNHYSNLEWVTSSENILHAIKNKLTGYTLSVRVYDEVTGQIEIIPTMKGVGDRFGVSVEIVKRYLTRYPELKFVGRYLFEPIVDDHDPINFEHCQVIVAHDYVGCKKLIADNLGLMAIMTGILAPTIGSNLREGRSNLIGGYIFKYQKDKTPFPTHSIEEAKASREKYLNRKFYTDGVDVLNYQTGQIDSYPTMVEAARITGVRLTLVRSRIGHGSLVPVQGYSFKRSEDLREFPHRSLEAISASFMESRSDGIGIKSTDLKTGVTNIYPSVKAAALAMNAARSAIKTHLGKQTTNPFKKRYKLQYV